MALVNHIESYNASYPLSYYQVGTIYSFYGVSNVLNATPASPEQISVYSEKLIALEQEETSGAITSLADPAAASVRRNGVSRYYAVVVGKSSSQKSSCITVMFINRNAGETEYLLKKYAVSHPVHFDGKDLMPVSTHANYETNKMDNQFISKPGQLTKAVQIEKVGQLTHIPRKDNPSTDSPGIGQLTHTKEDSISTAIGPKVGQLTWCGKKG